MFLTGCTAKGAVQSNVIHIVSTGQSNSIGGGEEPALTLTSSNRKISPDGLSIQPGGEPSTGCEDRGNTETHATAMADEVTRLTGASVIVSNSGEGGRQYTWIKKGGLGCAYAHSIQAVKTARADVPFVVLIHGESDAEIGTHGSEYESDLIELQSDYDADIKAITGQTETVQLYTAQFPDNPTYGTQAQQDAIHQAMRDAASKNANIHVLENVELGLGYKPGDCCHFTNSGYKILGERIADEIYK